MGRPRLDLQALLSAIPGVKRVYFQPPSGIYLDYPCITYEIDGMPASYADNVPFLVRTRYMVTVMDRDPDSLIAKKVAELPTSSFNRFYADNDLNHNVFTLYF